MNDIQVGDPATFTVDAFGGEQFKGVVDEVAPTSEQGSVVFNISDQRPTNQFAVYVRFDPTQYPQLKNGMKRLTPSRPNPPTSTKRCRISE